MVPEKRLGKQCSGGWGGERGPLMDLGEWWQRRKGDSFCSRRSWSSESTDVRVRLLQTMEDEQQEDARRGREIQQGNAFRISRERVLTALWLTLQPASLGFRNTEGEGRNKNSQVPDGNSQTRAMLQWRKRDEKPWVSKNCYTEKQSSTGRVPV